MAVEELLFVLLNCLFEEIFFLGNIGLGQVFSPQSVDLSLETGELLQVLIFVFLQHLRQERLLVYQAIESDVFEVELVLLFLLNLALDYPQLVVVLVQLPQFPHDLLHVFNHRPLIFFVENPIPEHLEDGPPQLALDFFRSVQKLVFLQVFSLQNPLLIFLHLFPHRLQYVFLQLIFPLEEVILSQASVQSFEVSSQEQPELLQVLFIRFHFSLLMQLVLQKVVEKLLYVRSQAVELV